MENNTTVLSFNTAINSGFEPRDYSWEKKDIPVGEYLAWLDFMIWSKKYMAINCYFTVKDVGAKIILSAYRSHDSEHEYLAGKTEMRYIPFNVLVKLRVELNGVGNPSLKGVELLSGTLRKDLPTKPG